MVKEKEEWLLAAKALLFLLPLSIGIQAGRHRREEQARLERSVSLSYEPASPVIVSPPLFHNVYRYCALVEPY